MPCCMAEKYKWCEGLPADISVEEGGETKRYCLFHAPKEHKRITVEAFNQWVFEHIKQAFQASGYCNLAGTIFPGNINFEEQKQWLNIHISFADSQFNDRAIFSGSTIHDIDFSGSKFDEVNFSGTFFDKCDFDNTQFNNLATFQQTHFKTVNFTSAIFTNVSFRQASFSCETKFEMLSVDDADFSQAKFNEISFRGAKFNKVRFCKTEFHKEANFPQVKFNGTTNFQSAMFQGRVDFSNSKFKGGTTFEQAIFRQEADFRESTFNGVNFTDVQFLERASFKDVKFLDVLYFGLKSSSFIHFETTVFKEDAYFRNSEYGDLEFSGAEFKKKVHFDDSKFRKSNFIACVFNEVDFQRAIFQKDISFFLSQFNEANFNKTEFRGNAFFDAANFKNYVLFSSSFKEAFFRDTAFQEGSSENSKIENRIVFVDVDLSNISFLNAPVEKMEFITPTWNGRDYYILRDEVTVRSALSRKPLECLKERFLHILSPEKKSEIGKAGVIYNKLKQKYKESHNEAEASKWHYGEKEMLRLSTPIKNPFQYIMIHLYWLSSGYAELPMRSGLFLIFLIVLMTALFALTGLVPFEGNSVYGVKEINSLFDVNSYKAFFALFLNTMQYALFQKVPLFKPSPASVCAGYLKLITMIVIPVQTALFVLSIRNRFRR